jgi:muramoyltetrapeptide carboxypeptidase
MPTVKALRKVLRIVAPSGAMETPELLPKAAQRLSKLGFEVEVDPQSNLIHQRFAGSDAERAQALENAILDPNIHVVMAARGGYGAHRLLPLLDWAKLAKAVNKQGKLLVGHSDFTAIQLALLSHGAPSLAGPCAGVDFGDDSLNAFMKTAFVQASKGEFHLTIKAKQAHSFTAQGMLWGGNLAMLCSLLGTHYFPKPAQIAGGILFLEDTNERPFRVERMLNQLHMAGVLSTQSAVLWGDFGKPVAATYDRGYGLPSVLKHVRDVLHVPVATGLPFGHVPKKATLPVGRHVQLSVTPTGFNLNLVEGFK